VKPPSGGFLFGGIDRKCRAALGRDVSSWHETDQPVQSADVR